MAKREQLQWEEESTNNQIQHPWPAINFLLPVHPYARQCTESHIFSSFPNKLSGAFVMRFWWTIHYWNMFLWDYPFMQGDWSSGRTLIHRILSWISFFNRFKHTNLGFSHWALEGLHSIGFFDRSITCKLFFIFLFGDWALVTWYLLLPIGGVEIHLYYCARTEEIHLCYCARTEKIFWTLKRVQISVKNNWSLTII